MLLIGTIKKSRVPNSDKMMARMGRCSSCQDVRSDEKIYIVFLYKLVPPDEYRPKKIPNMYKLA